MAKQITLQTVKDRIYQASAEGVEKRLEDIAYYATHGALTGGGRGDGVDTGAYVTSFSIVRAGQGGGRSRTSNNKPTGQDPAQKKQEGYQQLLGDIQGLNLKQMLEDERTKVILRNRSPHAKDVEDGWGKDVEDGWGVASPGYAVFAKVKRKFG